MSPQLLLMLLNVGALIFAGVHLSMHFQLGPVTQSIVAWMGSGGAYPMDIFMTAPSTPFGYTLDLAIIAGMWGVYTIIRIVFFVHKVCRHAGGLRVGRIFQ